MKRLKKNKMANAFVLAALIAAGTFSLATNAFAISNAAECQTEVKQAMRDLLKADVDAAALGKIDAAIVAAEESCKAENFPDAEAKLDSAHEMLKNATKN